MNARLGFSIAAHVDPQVLLIDEVLSVGDIAFQRRCVERMEKFKKSQGVSIVFVSHNLQAVANLCENTLYLRGSTRAHGPTSDVIEAYVRDTERHHGTSDRWVSVISTRLLDDEGRPTAQVTPGMKLTLCVEYLATEAVADLHFGFVVYRSNDLLTVYDRNYTSWELGVPSLAQGQTFQVNFRFRAHLTRGQYHIRCHVFHRPTQEYLSVVSPAGVLAVHEDYTHGGVADLAVQPSVAFLNAETTQERPPLSSVVTLAAGPGGRAPSR
jgi:lipopolysaccharide transport system ATP-binding protein